MLAFLIYGWSRSTNVVGQGAFHCPICRGKLACDVVQSQTWITFFFIPVIPLGRSQPQLACRGCRGEFPPPVEITRRHPSTNPLPWVLGIGGMMVVGLLMFCMFAVLVIGAAGNARKHEMAQHAEEERREIDRLVDEMDRDFERKARNWERPDVRPRDVMPPIAAPARPFVPADVKWTPEPPKTAEVPPPTPRVISVPNPPAADPLPLPEKPVEEPTLWEMTVDAGSPATPMRVSKTFSIPFKGAGTSFFFAPAPSPFVGVRRMASEGVLELWDWSKGRKVSEILKFNEPQPTLAISPDGKYAAIPVAEKLGFETIRTWTFRPAAKRDLMRPAIGFGLPRYAQFLIDDRLLCLSASGKELTLWDAAKVTQAGSSVMLPFDATTFSLSPTGRYAACVPGFGARLAVADTKDGRLVVDIPFPKSTHKFGQIHRAYGLAFSPDGKLLAALFDDLGTPRLVTWEVESGQIKLDASLGRRQLNISYRGQVIEWIEDGSFMLTGSLIVSSTGEPIGLTPKVQGSEQWEPRRAVNRESLLLAKDKRLVVMPLIETRLDGEVAP